MFVCDSQIKGVAPLFLFLRLKEVVSKMVQNALKMIYDESMR